MTNRIARTALIEIIAIGMMVIEYQLASAMLVDTIRYSINDLAAMEQIDTLLLDYTAVFIVVWSITSFGLFHSRQSLKSWAATLFSSFWGMIVVIMVSLASYTAFTITTDNWAIVNAIYAVYIIGNPAEYLAINFIVILALQLFFNYIFEV